MVALPKATWPMKMAELEQIQGRAIRAKQPSVVMFSGSTGWSCSRRFDISSPPSTSMPGDDRIGDVVNGDVLRNAKQTKGHLLVTKQRSTLCLISRIIMTLLGGAPFHVDRLCHDRTDQTA